MRLELKRIGNSTGVILPKELLARLDLRQGDAVYISELPGRELRLSPYDPDHAEAMATALEIFREYQDSLRALGR